MRRRRSSLATVPRPEVQDLLQEVRVRLPSQPTRRRRSSLPTVPRLEVEDLLHDIFLRLPSQPTRRRRSSLPTVPLLEVEDLLHDIFLRLPPEPSLLPRASVVCKRWRDIFSDPQFLRRFRKHHQKPPLLGFFVGGNFSTNHVFTPVLDAPDRIPAARFPLPWSRSTHEQWNFIGCRHGLVVLINETRRVTIVWDPLTDRQHSVAFPTGLNNDNGKRYWHAALFCVDPEDGHVHGDCFSSPFKLVLICVGCAQAFACLYDSASGLWGDVVSKATTDKICLPRPSILVGNTFCWLLGYIILEFDFERQTLAVIEKPADVPDNDYWSAQLLRKEDGGLGLAVLLDLSIQLWERKSNCDGVASWELLHKTIPLQGLFPHRVRSDHRRILMVGYDEDTNMIVLSTMIGDFMLQIESMQITNISKRNHMCSKIFYPYANFFTTVAKS